MIDLLPKVVSELIFRALVALIGWFGTQPFVQDVVNALLERWDRLGGAAAIWSALDAVPRAVQSRVTWFANHAASHLTERSDLTAPILAFIGGMYFAFDFALWVAHLLAASPVHGQAWLLQTVIWAMAAPVVIAAAYVFCRLSMQIVDLNSEAFDWAILAITCVVVFQAAVRAYLSGSWHALSQMLAVIAGRAVVALAIGWFDAIQEQVRWHRKRRADLPSYLR